MKTVNKIGMNLIVLMLLSLSCSSICADDTILAPKILIGD